MIKNICNDESISKFLPITNKCTGSLQFRVNDYLALLVINKTSLEPYTFNMLVCLRSYGSYSLTFK